MLSSHGAAAGGGELAAELAEDEVLAAALDQAEGRGIPERGRSAVADEDLVALRDAEERGELLAHAADEVLHRGLAVRGAEDRRAPTASSASSCAGRTFEGPQPKRPSAGRRSRGISIAMRRF